MHLTPREHDELVVPMDTGRQPLGRRQVVPGLASLIARTDLARHAGAELAVLERVAARMRGGGPTIAAQVVRSAGVEAIAPHVPSAWSTAS